MLCPLKLSVDLNTKIWHLSHWQLSELWGIWQLQIHRIRNKRVFCELGWNIRIIQKIITGTLSFGVEMRNKSLKNVYVLTFCPPKSKEIVLITATYSPLITRAQTLRRTTRGFEPLWPHLDVRLLPVWILRGDRVQKWYRDTSNHTFSLSRLLLDIPQGYCFIKYVFPTFSTWNVNFPKWTFARDQ